jgi:hypothetical protein
MKAILTFFLSSFVIFSGSSQNIQYTPLNNVPVSNFKGALPNAWAGGLNSATFASFDFDLDGQEDLLVLDRQQNRPLVFLAKQNSYQYAPALSALLPPLNRYALFYDFDKDNRKDLFTATVVGPQLYRNISTSSQLKFQLYRNPIYTRYYSDSPSNMTTNVLDVPYLGDIDKDGDMDILHFNSQTGENAMIETNFSMEKYGKPDSLYFGTTNEKWGGFGEVSCTNYLFGSDGRVFYNYRLEHVGSGALMVFDADNNGFPDLLVGKQDCQTLNYLKNSGSGTVAFFNKLSTFYPTGSATDTLYYPIPCMEDVDFDGVKDLLVTMGLNIPNPNTDLQNTAWYYKNTGTNALPNFQPRSHNFIQNTILDLGQNSVPAFADADGDGDLDLFVSNSTNLATRPSSIFYYQNTGSQTIPTFSLVDSNYFGLAAEGFEDLFITFADLNNDNRKDLVYIGTKNYTYSIQIANNQSSSGLNFSTSVPLPLPITEPSTLCFYPIDADNLTDVLVGDAEGNLNYYKNTGTTAAPVFTLSSSNYGGLSSHNQNASASICDVNKDLLADLIFANDSGTAKICLDFLHQDSLYFHYGFLQTGTSPALLGQQVTLSQADLDLDSYPELIFGNAVGGLSMFHFNSVVSGWADPFWESAMGDLLLWPNPSEGNFEVQIPELGTLELTDNLGKQIFESKENSASTLRLSKLPPGFYIATFWGQSGKKYSKKLVVR